MRLREWLAEGRPVVLDGGLSTALEELGADLDDPLWTARALRDSPSVVLAAHAAFVAAGAEIVIAASYQAPDALLARAVEVARGAGVYVAGSVAPYGALLAGGQEYTGAYAVPAGWHERRMELLLSAEPDCVAVETQPRIDEAVAIASLVEGVDCWVSFTCRDGARIGDGSAIEDAVAAVSGLASVAAVGVNCTAPEHVPSLLARARTVTDLPLVAYPNAGGGWDAAAKRWRGGGAGAGATDFRDAALIGGCCGVGPAALRALAVSVRESR